MGAPALGTGKRLPLEARFLQSDIAFSVEIIGKSISMNRLLATLVLIAVSLAPRAGADTVVGSRHDLSSGTSTEVCVFCHTPHNAETTIDAPLWNRFLSTQTFTLYGSPTMDTVPTQPMAASLLCLSCHDGVLSTTTFHGVAVDNKHYLRRYHGDLPGVNDSPSCERCHPDMYSGRPAKWLGTDLSDDHPISMAYPTPAQDPFFNTPPDPNTGWGGSSSHDVKLYNGNVECGSCHNAHDPQNVPFLRKPNAGSALCLTCHDR